MLAIAAPGPAREEISFGRIRQLDNFGDILAIFDRIFPRRRARLSTLRPVSIHMIATSRRTALRQAARAVAASLPPC